MRTHQDVPIHWDYKENSNQTPQEIVGFSFTLPTANIYEGFFHPSPIWPPDSILAGNTVDLVFGPKIEVDPIQHNHPLQVMDIVLKVITEYLSLLPSRCISYTCDDNDGRGAARQRLFVKTFHRNSTPKLELFHQPINIYGQVLQFGLIYHQDNNHQTSIQQTLFTELRLAESK
ncbi:MAG TPA: hypothetical protein DCE41_11155 [Cytophagales bacterium]|nr:hypothetical protein [Cytophagales bacterium]HAP61102.1 hypothetical protein [Cytophagales bacterium]